MARRGFGALCFVGSLLDKYSSHRHTRDRPFTETVTSLSNRIPLQTPLLVVVCCTQACGRGGRWERAVSLMDDMRRQGLDPDGLTYR